jgi:hypothetical protein
MLQIASANACCILRGTQTTPYLVSRSARYFILRHHLVKLSIVSAAGETDILSKLRSIHLELKIDELLHRSQENEHDNRCKRKHTDFGGLPPKRRFDP